jgi:hypothetical protein
MERIMNIQAGGVKDFLSGVFDLGFSIVHTTL